MLSSTMKRETDFVVPQRSILYAQIIFILQFLAVFQGTHLHLVAVDWSISHVILSRVELVSTFLKRNQMQSFI